MKKQCFLLTLLMTMVMMAMSPQKMWANVFEPTGAVELSKDGKWNVNVASLKEGESAIYRFVAPRDGMLTVYSKGYNDTYGYLYDSKKEKLIGNDDGGVNNNFKYRYNVTKGETYYIEASGYRCEAVKNMDLYVSLGDVTYTAETYYKVGNLKSKNDASVAYHNVSGSVLTDVKTKYIESGTNIEYHANAVEGTNFVGWYDKNNKQVSTQADFSFTITKDTTLTAVYSVKDNYSVVKLDYNGYGSVAFANGKDIIIAQNNSTVALKTMPDNDGEFVGWTLNLDPHEGEIEYLSTDPSYSYTVKGDAMIYGVFSYTGINKPVLYEVYTKNSHRYFELRDYVVALNNDGEYEVEIFAEVLPSETDPLVIYDSSYCSDDPEITYTSKADGSMLVTVVLNGEEGNSTYKLTFKKGVVIYTSRNIEERGDVICSTTKGEKTTDGAWPLGTKVTVTAIPAEDCTFVKWMVWDEEANNLVDIDLPNPVTVSNSISLKAMFSRNGQGYCSVEDYGPGRAKVTVADGYDFYYGDVDLGTSVTYSVDTSYLTEEELDILNIKFKGWYDEYTDKLVSTEKTYTTTITEDTQLYSVYTSTIYTPNNWATYCDGFDDYTVEGGKAYAAEYVEDAGDGSPAIKLTSIEGGVFKYKGVLLRDTDHDGKVTINYTDGDSQYVDNQLIGNVDGEYNSATDECDRKDLTLDENYTYYGLYNKLSEPEFRRYTGGTLPIHRAVLMLDEEVGYEAKLRVFIDGEEADTTTAIEIAKAVGDDTTYDLSGRRVNSASKGVYIKNGKKVMVK